MGNSCNIDTDSQFKLSKKNTLYTDIKIDPHCLGCIVNNHEKNPYIEGPEINTSCYGVPKGSITSCSIAYLKRNEIIFFKLCSGKNLAAIRYFLKKDVNVNILDEDRTSPLHVACKSSSLQVVEELINWGANLNIADMGGWTPLHVAAYYQKPAICNLLLKKGADPYCLNRRGETPWDLVKDKSVEDVFSLHFDRLELRKMTKKKHSNAVVSVSNYDDDNEEVKKFDIEKPSRVNQYNSNYTFDIDSKYSKSNNNGFISQFSMKIHNTGLQYNSRYDLMSNPLNKIHVYPNHSVEIDKNLKNGFSLNNMSLEEDDHIRYLKYDGRNNQIPPKNNLITETDKVNNNTDIGEALNPLKSPGRQKYYVYYHNNLRKNQKISILENGNSHNKDSPNLTENFNEDNQNEADDINDNMDINGYNSGNGNSCINAEGNNNNNNNISKADKSIVNNNNFEEDNNEDEYNGEICNEKDMDINSMIDNHDENKFAADDDDNYDIVSESKSKLILPKITASLANRQANIKLEVNDAINNMTLKDDEFTQDDNKYIIQIPLVNKQKILNYALFPGNIHDNNNANNNNNNKLAVNNISVNNSVNGHTCISLKESTTKHKDNGIIPSPKSLKSILFINHRPISIYKIIYNSNGINNNLEYKLLNDELDHNVYDMQFHIDLKYAEAIYQMGVDLFNYDGLKGLSFLILFRLVQANPYDIANFLHKDDHLASLKRDKYEVSKLLTNINIHEVHEILSHYVECFNFDNMSYIMALRFYLSELILDNDPEKIDLLLHAFAKKYFYTINTKKNNMNDYKVHEKHYQVKNIKNGQIKVKTKIPYLQRLNQYSNQYQSNKKLDNPCDKFDTFEIIHMLSFATVMLDINLNHTSQNSNNSIDIEESKREFFNNLRGINRGDNLSKTFINSIFDGVRKFKLLKLYDNNNALNTCTNSNIIFNNDKSPKSLVSLTFKKLNIKNAKLIIDLTRQSKNNKNIIKQYVLYVVGCIGLIGIIVDHVYIIPKYVINFIENKIKLNKQNLIFIHLNNGSTNKNNTVVLAKFQDNGQIKLKYHHEYIFNLVNLIDFNKLDNYINNLRTTASV